MPKKNGGLDEFVRDKVIDDLIRDRSFKICISFIEQQGMKPEKMIGWLDEFLKLPDITEDDWRGMTELFTKILKPNLFAELGRRSSVDMVANLLARFSEAPVVKPTQQHQQFACILIVVFLEFIDFAKCAQSFEPTGKDVGMSTIFLKLSLLMKTYPMLQQEPVLSNCNIIELSTDVSGDESPRAGATAPSKIRTRLRRKHFKNKSTQEGQQSQEAQSSTHRLISLQQLLCKPLTCEKLEEAHKMLAPANIEFSQSQINELQDEKTPLHNLLESLEQLDAKLSPRLRKVSLELLCMLLKHTNLLAGSPVLHLIYSLDKKIVFTQPETAEVIKSIVANIKQIEYKRRLPLLSQPRAIRRNPRGQESDDSVSSESRHESPLQAVARMTAIDPKDFWLLVLAMCGKESDITEVLMELAEVKLDKSIKLVVINGLKLLHEKKVKKVAGLMERHEVEPLTAVDEAIKTHKANELAHLYLQVNKETPNLETTKKAMDQAIMEETKASKEAEAIAAARKIAEAEEVVEADLKTAKKLTPSDSSAPRHARGRRRRPRQEKKAAKGGDEVSRAIDNAIQAIDIFIKRMRSVDTKSITDDSYSNLLGEIKDAPEQALIFIKEQLQSSQIKSDEKSSLVNKLLKLFCSGNAVNTFKLLDKFGIVDNMFPEDEQSADKPKDAKKDMLFSQTVTFSEARFQPNIQVVSTYLTDLDNAYCDSAKPHDIEKIKAFFIVPSYVRFINRYDITKLLDETMMHEFLRTQPQVNLPPTQNQGLFAPALQDDQRKLMNEMTQVISSLSPYKELVPGISTQPGSVC